MPPSRVTARFALRVLVAAAVLGLPACERPPRDASSGSAAARKPERTPRATIEQLIAARESRAYQTMTELIVPGATHQVVDTLMAVDEFLQDNRTLCNYVRDEFAPGLSQSIDQSHLGAHLDVFSRYVELIDQHLEGDVATVSFTVDRQVPLRHARLVLTDGQWRYDPGGGYDPQLPEAFRRMARGVRQVLDDLKGGQLDAAMIRAEPERLIEEVRVRLLPGIKMLPAAPATQPDGD